MASTDEVWRLQGAKEEDEGQEEAADFAALAAIRGHEEEWRKGQHVRSGGTAPSITSATQADALRNSQPLIGVVETAMAPLKEVQAQAVVAKRNPKGAAKAACYRQR